MKRILYIASVDMYNNSGGALATKAYYNALIKLFPQRIDLLHAEEININKQFPPSNNVILIPRKNKIVDLMHVLEGHVPRFYPDVINYIIHEKNKYSLCIINGGVHAGDFILKIKQTGIKVIVIHHNFESEYHVDNKTIMSMGGWCTFWIRKNEKRAYLNADINCFLTKSDINVFKEHYGGEPSKNKLLGCFETNETNIPTPIKIESIKTFVISGAMDFHQTECGILDFFYNIFLKYNKQNKDSRLIITGRRPSPKIKKIAEVYCDIVSLYPNPSDISSYIRQGDIYICPVSMGGGLKLRIMDGLRLGMPIITHENSVRGYENFEKKEYFRAYKSLSSFINAVELINKSYKKNTFTPESIQFDYLNYFGFNAGLKRMKDILNCI